MKKEMIKKDNIIENILIYFILLQPILDALTSLGIEYISESLTVGIIIRVLFLLITAIGTLFIVNKNHAKKIFIYYMCLTIYSCIYIYNMYSLNGTNMIIAQIKGLVKTIYFPLLFIDFYYIYKDRKILIKDEILNNSLVGYTLIILLTRIIGVEYETYRGSGVPGSVGLFYAANEIGAIVCMLAPFLMYKLVNKKDNITIISLILLLYTTLEMGTKVPYIGFILLIICIIFIELIKKVIKDNTYNKKYITYSLILLVILYLISGYFPAGNNMNVMYGKIFPVIKMENNKIDEETSKENISDSNQLNKNSDDKFIENLKDFTETSANGRDDNFKGANKKFIKSKIQNKLFGIGYITEYDEGKYGLSKTVESDYFDILFSQGIIGTIVIYIPFILIFIKYIIYSFKKIKYIIKNDEIILNAFSVFIAFGAALMAGHVLVSPAVSIYLIMSIILMVDKLEKIKLEEKNE